MVFEKQSMTNSVGINIETIFPIYQEEDILLKTFPFLGRMSSKDGLYSIRELSEKFEILGTPWSTMGYLKSKESEFTIMFHPFLRRSYSYFSNFNPGIINLLFRMYQRGQIEDFLIALDDKTLMLTKDWRKVIERERWHGPVFNADIPKNKHEVTKYASTQIEANVNKTLYTEYYWTAKKNACFQLEVEELTNTDKPNINDTFGCKYVHSLYDNGTFNHIDGSIRIYDKCQLQTRIDCEINHYPNRDSKYKKLFRVDGDVPFDLWKSIIQCFLPYNESVSQYFNGE